LKGIHHQLKLFPKSFQWTENLSSGILFNG